MGLLTNFFHPSNLISLIVMGCRIACFGWRGLKNLLTSTFGLKFKILYLRTWMAAQHDTLNYMHCNAIRGLFALPFEVPPDAIWGPMFCYHSRSLGTKFYTKFFKFREFITPKPAIAHPINYYPKYEIWGIGHISSHPCTNLSPSFFRLCSVEFLNSLWPNFVDIVSERENTYVHTTSPNSRWNKWSSARKVPQEGLIKMFPQLFTFTQMLKIMIKVCRLAQVGENPQSLTCSWILSSKYVCSDSRDIHD